MERLTRRTRDGKYEIIDVPRAADLLAKFEDLREYVLGCEVTLPQELEKLRQEGKEKSYKFREIFGQKLINTSFISLMNRFGIK